MPGAAHTALSRAAALFALCAALPATATQVAAVAPFVIGPDDERLAKALALTATGVCLIELDESVPPEEEDSYFDEIDFGVPTRADLRVAEAVDCFADAVELAPEERTPSRQLVKAFQLAERDADAAREAVRFARVSGRRSDWIAALCAASAPDAPRALFDEAVGNIHGDLSSAEAAMVAAAHLSRDPGSPAGPAAFRAAVEKEARTPIGVVPDRLYGALSDLLRDALARGTPFAPVAVAAIRLSRELALAAPPERRGACEKALLREARAWMEVESAGSGVAPVDGLGVALLAHAEETRLAPLSEAAREGDELYDRGDAVGAVRAWKAAMADHPRAVPLLANNAAYVSAISGGDLDEALRLADIAVSARPLDAPSLDTLAWIFHLRGDVRNAMIAMRKALARAGSSPSQEMREHAAAILSAAGKPVAAARWALPPAQPQEGDR